MEKALKNKLEKEGEEKATKIMNNITKGTIDIKDVSCSTYLNIIKEGNEEFLAKMGRPLTYGEMRELYG